MFKKTKKLTSDIVCIKLGLAIKNREPKDGKRDSNC